MLTTLYILLPVIIIKKYKKIVIPVLVFMNVHSTTWAILQSPLHVFESNLTWWHLHFSTICTNWQLGPFAQGLAQSQEGMNNKYRPAKNVSRKKSMNFFSSWILTSHANRQLQHGKEKTHQNANESWNSELLSSVVEKNWEQDKNTKKAKTMANEC